MVAKLFDTIAPRFETRPGGYTRILRLGYRRGDSAEKAQIELVGSEYNPNAETDKAGRRKRRSRRASAAACAPRPDRLRGKAKARGRDGGRRRRRSRDKEGQGSASLSAARAAAGPIRAAKARRPPHRERPAALRSVDIAHDEGRALDALPAFSLTIPRPSPIAHRPPLKAQFRARRSANWAESVRRISRNPSDRYNAWACAIGGSVSSRIAPYPIVRASSISAAAEPLLSPIPAVVPRSTSSLLESQSRMKASFDRQRRRCCRRRSNARPGPRLEANQWWAHVRFLADDKLEGRNVGYARVRGGGPVCRGAVQSHRPQTGWDERLPPGGEAREPVAGARSVDAGACPRRPGTASRHRPGRITERARRARRLSRGADGLSRLRAVDPRGELG